MIWKILVVVGCSALSAAALASGGEGTKTGAARATKVRDGAARAAIAGATKPGDGAPRAAAGATKVKGSRTPAHAVSDPASRRAKTGSTATATRSAPSEVLSSPAVPKIHEAALAAGLPPGQRLVQTLAGDLDGDGKVEWIAIGEPERNAGAVSIAIFAPAKGKEGPELRFAQLMRGDGLEVAGAQVMEVKPVGEVVVLVGAAPHKGGDSRFIVDFYAWNGRNFRPIVPETAEFHSQGGFSIEPGAAPYEGDELVVWSYIRGDHEQLYDHHRYTYKRWRWDTVRFAAEVLESETNEAVANAEAAGKAAGAKRPDLRRQTDRVAEVP